MLLYRLVHPHSNARTALRLSALFCLLTLLWPAAAGAADSSRLYFEPATATVDVGSTITVSVSLAGTHPVYGIDVTVVYDPALLEIVDADATRDGVQVQPGALFLGKQTLAVANSADNATGQAQYAVSMFGEKEGVIQGGSVVVLQFRGKAPGQATLTLAQETMAVDPAQLVIPLTLETAQVTVRGTASSSTAAPTATAPATSAPAQATTAQPTGTVDAEATIAAQVTPAVTLAPATATAVAQAIAAAAATATKGKITPIATSQPTATVTPAPGGLAGGSSGSIIAVVIAIAVIVAAAAAWLVWRSRRQRD
jgi:hypothetical protein